MEDDPPPWRVLLIALLIAVTDWRGKRKALVVMPGDGPAEAWEIGRRRWTKVTDLRPGDRVGRWPAIAVVVKRVTVGARVTEITLDNDGVQETFTYSNAEEISVI